MKSDFDIKDKDLIKEKHHPFRKLFFAIILIIILTIIYSRYLGTSGLIVKEYQIKSKNISEAYNGLKIAHFTDFHYGRTTFISELKNLVTDINKTKPDIIIFTGDLIDRDSKLTENEETKISEELKKLNCTYGKYYVEGNHDIKFDKYNEIMTNAGFINLNNSHDVIYNNRGETILISGISTKINNDFLKNIFAEGKNYNYKINIMHYPDYFDDIKTYNYDLVLAGHSHNGQINIPFYGPIIKPIHAQKYYAPHYKIDNTDLYISSGIGVSEYNFRLFNRPSYNLYRLIKK